MSNINYRPEIDGLRAISVIGVLFYHAGLSFPGGYVGVDVFFVISGFLITSIIAKGLDNGSFSFAEFWTRRIKRILPAVSTLVVAVLVAGFFILDPESLKELAESAFAQSTMWSNFFFLNASSGYFHARTEMMPLLHTWSLAVEEQFYLFLPLLLYVLFKKMRKHAFMVLSLIAALSFTLSIVITNKDQSQSFYLLHTRTWELLAGSLLALGTRRINLPRAVSELLSLLGLGLIFTPMFLLDAHSSFPGLNALAPVAGAVAFIAGTQNHTTIAGRIASLKPVVFIGLISYSLYLWHWPFFAFSRHLFVAPDQHVLIAVQMTASIVLAILSWRFIETPFRNRNLLTTRKAAIRFGVIVTVILCVVTAAVSVLNGFPSRHRRYASLLHDMDTHGERYKSRGDGVEIGNSDKESVDFVLWGDSHAMMFAQSIDQLAAERDLRGIAYISTARIPITNLDRPRYRKDVIDYNRKVFEKILSTGASHLILASRWSENLTDETGERLVSDRTDGKAETSLQDARASMKRQFGNMLEVCRENGITVYVIKQTPETTDDQTAMHFYIRKRYPAFNPGTPDRYTIAREEHYRRQAAFESVLEVFQEDENLFVVDPAPPFFRNAEARLEAYSEEHSHYRDDNHLTEYAVNKYMRPVFSAILDKIETSHD